MQKWAAEAEEARDEAEKGVFYMRHMVNDVEDQMRTAIAALKRVRYCQKAPADWVHPWVLAARTGCVQKPK